MRKNLKIFISYSRKDARDFSKDLFEALSSFSEYEVFKDVNNIVPGDIWSNIIEENISKCNIFILIITRLSLKSSEVEKEFILAKNENKRIIPCIYSNIKY